MLRPGEIGGMEIYVRQLVAILPELDPRLTLVLFCAEYNHETFDAGRGIERHLLDAEAFHRLNADVLSGYRLDLWFCPLLTLEPADPGMPAVATIPDLQHETLPEMFSDEILAWRRQHYARTARSIDRLLTLSEFSRRELIDKLVVDPRKVIAIPLAADEGMSRPGSLLERAAVEERYALPVDFLLFPANTWPHKNHRALFAALALYKREHGGCPLLVLTGAEVENTGFDELLAELDLVDEVRFLGYLPLGELRTLYAAARALIFPSLFEGFGLPVLEAMAVGCPVLCSRSTSLPEVAGDAALFFDPRDPADIAAKLASFFARGELEDDLRRRGHQRARQFSWRRTGEETLAVFHQLAVAPRPFLSSEEWPRISIVTPSYHQAPFIERTLRSVLEQDYPHLQYLVFDGGSQDATVEILERYQRHFPGILSYVSEKDRGQAHAVNKGWRRAEGEILGWLNSDDTYEPDSLAAVAASFRRSPSLDWLYGCANYIDSDDAVLAAYPTRLDFDWQALAHDCFICQPTAFLRRRVTAQGLWLDENLQTCMDYDFWIRIGRRFKATGLDIQLANSRMHDDNKTLGQRKQVFAEIIGTVKRHYGFVPPSWAIGKAHHLLQDGDPIHPEPVNRKTLVLGALLHARFNWNRPGYLWRHGLRSLQHLARRLRGASESAV